MASFGKKILSAFIEINEAEQASPVPHSGQPASNAASVADHTATPLPAHNTVAPDAHNKFSDHFNALFAEAHLPGPGYYEFTKMTAAMQMITDEKARYCAAFAGLQVQGLSKGQLLSSALEYLHVLDNDAAAFHETVAAAQSEQVQSRRKEMEEAQTRIQELSQEIMQLQQRVTTLSQEVAENEARIEHNSVGYAAALESVKQQLQQDIEKIKQHVL
jgi:hypothetical protein